MIEWFAYRLPLGFIILFLNINIVHVRSRAPAWSCLIATKLTFRKLVTTFHGTYNFSSNIKKFYNSVMVKSDLLIAGSNFIFSHINDNYPKYLNPKKKFLVIFRGINTEYFDPDNLKKNSVSKLKTLWQIEENSKVILLPGRLTSWKGHELFIEAINKFKKLNSDLDFTAIILGSDQGRTVYKKKLERLVEQYDLTNNFRFIEKCEYMPAAYMLSDIIVSSSIEPEAFGRVSVEAQAMQVPIIASDISCHTALLGSAYVGLHSVGSAVDVSKKLHTFFFDELCRKQMEKQLSSCPAAESTLGKEQEELRKVLSYIQV